MNTDSSKRPAVTWLYDRYIRFLAVCMIALSAIGAGTADAAPRLDFSLTANRANPQSLQGALLKGKVYIQFIPDAPMGAVTFWLDDPNPANPTGPRYKLESNAPYDFNGTNTKNGLARAWTTSTVADGNHTITARAKLPNGTLAPPVSATFTVANNAKTLVFQPASLNFQAVQGGDNPDDQCVTVSASDGSSSAFTAGDDVTWLSVTPVTNDINCLNASPLAGSPTTPAQLRISADLAGLGVGTYTGNVTVQDPASSVVRQLPVTLEVHEEQGCSPLPCSDILIQLPYMLRWDIDQGKITDRNGHGTGFTYLLPTTRGQGYIPQNIVTDPTVAGGRLTITTTKGLMQTSANTLDNGLGVGIAVPNQVSRISTTLAAPLPAASGNFEQAGLWFGVDEDNYLKLNVYSTGTRYNIQAVMEVNGGVTKTLTASPSLAGVTDINLSLVVNPNDQTVTAGYRLNGGTELAMGSFTPPPEFFSFDAAGIDPRIGTRSFGGIYASHRNGPAPLNYGFKSFSVTSEEGSGPPPTSGGGMDFSRSSASFNSPTSLAWGPDNRLYVAGLLGNIEAITPHPVTQLAGTVQRQVIDALQQAFPGDGNARLTLGIAVDPDSTPDNVVLWVGHSSPSLNAGKANSSMVSRISKSDPGSSNYDTVTNVITGLPRAIANHAINSLHFGPDGKLYIALGGNTGAGAPNTSGSEFKTRPEQPLSAALLVADVKAPSFQGQCASAVDDTTGTASKVKPATCDVEVYSSGLRNIYDFAIHSNGQIYGTDNGLGVTGTFPKRPLPDCQGFANPASYTSGGQNPGEQPDLLLRLLPGKYYGHPNPARDECVFKDGSYQGTSPLANYEPPLTVLGTHLSSDGIAEYPVNVGCAGLKGELLIANYGISNDLTRVKLTADGNGVVTKSSLVGKFTDPLPVAVSPTGIIYVGELGASKVTAVKPESLGCWSNRAAFPQQILDAAGAALGGKFYVVGGKNASVHFSTLYIYTPENNTWTQGPNRPGTAVENAAVVAFNGKLYVFGGSTSPFAGALNEAAVFDPATNAWTTLARMPTARGGLTAQVINGLIYVAGGMDSTGASLNKLEVYNPASNSWGTVAPMATRRDNPASAAFGNKLYVFGGRTRNADGTSVNAVLSSVEIYNPATNTWSAGAPMPTARRTMAVGYLNGRVQLMGGEGTPTFTSVFPKNEEYNPVANTWRTLTDMSLPRHGAASGTIGDTVFVVGGGPNPGTALSNANTAFQY